MRRAAFQVLRTARRSHIRKALFTKSSPFSSTSYVLGLRSGTTVHRTYQSSTILQSSMYLRNFSVALISGAVASGAWYAFRGTPVPEVGVVNSNPSTSYAGTNYKLGGSSAEDAAATRRALVVENGQFYTGDIVGDQPLTKETGASGRLVVEMLTPEQATQKLRQNEEAYAVGRGRGVARYDVVQVASNNPIEDDHAEQIVDVPQSLTVTQDGAASSDWMFWGVFDGHRYVDCNNLPEFN
jgi:pyruvate dehydrogenase phosphatase